MAEGVNALTRSFHKLRMSVPARMTRTAYAVPALAGATLGLLAMRYAVAAYAGLTDDEAYYRLWSLAPSLSFYDHPPIVAWIIAAGRALAGDSELGVRFAAPLMLAAGVAIAWRTASLVSGQGVAITASWFLLAMPLMAVGGIVTTPDLPSVLFYGLVVLGLAELERSHNANWWLAIGIFAGCGLLSKYTNFFAGAAILIWLVAVPENRKWFRSPQLWAGGLIAALIFTPVMVWNWQHEWTSFAKQFGRVGEGREFGVRFPLEMAGAYVALASPVIAFLSFKGLADVTAEAMRERGSMPVLLSASILPLLSYFSVHALHSRVQANWLAPLYPLLAICAAIGLGRMAAEVQSRMRPAAICLGLAITAVIYMHALTPLITLRKDPAAQMRGWPGFAAAIRPLLDANDAHWIATSGYAVTGQLSFAFRGELPVVQLNERFRHAHLPAVPGATLSKPALYISLEKRSSEVLLASCFAKHDRIATVSRDDGTSERATYAVYRVSTPRAACAHERSEFYAAP